MAHPAAARRRRAHLAGARRRAARRAGRAGGPPRRRAGPGRAAARAAPRSTARSSRSARTTWCSTWPRRRCARADPLITLASSNVGSLGGLVALRDGLCHLAGSHLLDPATGEYTLPYLDRILGAGTTRAVAVVRLVHREQGLIVAPGNPLGLSGIDDLARPDLRYVNRQRGAGTRVLLDHELARRGVDPAAISGYAREEHTHLAVAAAVAAGRADTGLGILAAARAFGLDFVPVTRSPTTWCCAPPTLDDELLRPAVDAAGREPTSAPRSRSSAATPAPRPATGSASQRRPCAGSGASRFARVTINVCIAGATGWTGRAIAAAVREAPDLTLRAAVARSAAGSDLGTAWGESTIGVPIHAKVADALDGVDVLVDYTSHLAVLDHALTAIDRRVAVVIGTSGLSSDDFTRLAAAADQAGIGVIAAGNFSLTAALAQAAALLVAPHLPHREIVDYASAGKKDAPSGTAMELAERLGEANRPQLGVPIAEIAGHPEARGTTIAGTQVHSLRLPSFVVSTEVVFALPDETLHHPPRRRSHSQALRGGHVAGDSRRSRAPRPGPWPRHPAAQSVRYSSP